MSALGTYNSPDANRLTGQAIYEPPTGTRRNADRMDSGPTPEGCDEEREGSQSPNRPAGE
jgi:hypothetical protein